MNYQVKNERLLLVTLAAVNFTHIVDFMIVMPLGPVFMREFGIGPRQFSFILSAYTFSAAISGLLSATLIDRYDRKYALLVAYGGFLLGTLACAATTTYAALLTARLVAGAFGGVIGSLVLAIVGDVIPQERRAHGVGIIMAAFSAAAVAGVPLGLLLTTLFNWHAAFVFVALVGLGVWVAIHLTMPNFDKHVNHASNHRPSLLIFGHLRHNPHAIMALGMTFFLVLGHFAVIQFVSPFLVSNVGFGEGQLSYIYLLGGLATLFSSPWVGRLSDRHGRPQVLTGMMLLSFVPIFLITHLDRVPIVWALVVTTLLFVFASGRFVPATAISTMAVPPRYRGGFMSLNSSVQSLSSGVASMAAGLIVSADAAGRLLHYPTVGYLAMGTGLVAALLAWRVRPWPDPEKI